MTRRPSRALIAAELAALVAAIVVALLGNGFADWDLRPRHAPSCWRWSAISRLSTSRRTRMRRSSASLASIVVAIAFFGGPRPRSA